MAILSGLALALILRQKKGEIEPEARPLLSPLPPLLATSSKPPSRSSSSDLDPSPAPVAPESEKSEVRQPWVQRIIDGMKELEKPVNPLEDGEMRHQALALAGKVDPQIRRDLEIALDKNHVRDRVLWMGMAGFEAGYRFTLGSRFASTPKAVDLVFRSKLWIFASHLITLDDNLRSEIYHAFALGLLGGCYLQEKSDDAIIGEIDSIYQVRKEYTWLLHRCLEDLCEREFARIELNDPLRLGQYREFCENHLPRMKRLFYKPHD